jgi:hypothetical protein
MLLFLELRVCVFVCYVRRRVYVIFLLKRKHTHGGEIGKSTQRATLFGRHLVHPWRFFSFFARAISLELNPSSTHTHTPHHMRDNDKTRKLYMYRRDRTLFCSRCMRPPPEIFHYKAATINILCGFLGERCGSHSFFMGRPLSFFKGIVRHAFC